MKKLTITISFIALMQLICINLNSQNFIKIDASFYSEVLDTIKKVDVYLPNDYYEHPEQQYAAIYYLHGGGGNQNEGSTNANWYYFLNAQDTTICSPPAIFVCPDGSCPPYMGSDYVNSVLYGNYEDYFMQDVISFVETNFRVLTERDFRLITGISMGGFGSSRLSAKYPEKFRAAIPISGFPAITESFIILWRDLVYAENGSYTNLNSSGFKTQVFLTIAGGASPNLNNPPLYVDIPWDSTGALIDSVCEKWYSFDASSLLKDIPANLEISYFLDCGTQDYMGTYPLYLQFMDSLDMYDIAYDYQYFDGGHVFDIETWIVACHWIDSIINQSFQIFGIETANRNASHLIVYPNPFTSSTTIQFELSKSEDVELIIYDHLGQQIKTLFKGTANAGKLQVKMDASSLSTGIYFCRLHIGNKTITKKIIKIK